MGTSTSATVPWIETVSPRAKLLASAGELIEQLGAEVVACAFVVELDDLRGRQKIGEYRIHSLLHYSDLF